MPLKIKSTSSPIMTLKIDLMPLPSPHSLRTREARPPLTVVLVNNKGGGIFSFLPIAGEVTQEQFSALWATPQNVDLEGEQLSLLGQRMYKCGY